MAKVTVLAGVCGMRTEIMTTAEQQYGPVSVRIESDCPHIRKIAEALAAGEVDPLKEITYRGEGPLTLRLARQYSPHPACPVPSGIIKAIEVAAGLALPKDASIRVEG
jgi:hypothetical protein